MADSPLELQYTAPYILIFAYQLNAGDPNDFARRDAQFFLVKMKPRFVCKFRMSTSLV